MYGLPQSWQLTRIFTGQHMNIFQPYTQMGSAPGNLHIAAGAKLQWALFILYRMAPVVFIASTAFTMLVKGATHIPMAFNYLLVIAAMVCLPLLFKPYAIELQVAGQNIQVTRKTITGISKLTIAVADIACIKAHGNGGAAPAATFALYTKANRRFVLLSIPFWLVNKGRVLLIAQTLGQFYPFK
jgi:hypothetical protein